MFWGCGGRGGSGDIVQILLCHILFDLAPCMHASHRCICIVVVDDEDDDDDCVDKDDRRRKNANNRMDGLMQDVDRVKSNKEN